MRVLNLRMHSELGTLENFSDVSIYYFVKLSRHNHMAAWGALALLSWSSSEPQKWCEVDMYR